MSIDQIVAELSSSPLGAVFAFVWGALWGSFANVCVVRVPLKLSVVRPGSKCFACNKPVAWYDNLPILSWFILRGKCRNCGAKFSIRYALVEAAAGLLALALWQITVIAPVAGDFPPMQLGRFFIYFYFVMVMLTLAFIDLDTKTLPDVITLPSIIIFYVAGLALPERRWLDGVIGIAAGYLVVRAIADGYYYLTGREGMGYGDGKLLAVIGALLGWQAIPFAMFVGSMLGTVIALPVLIVQRRKAAATQPAPAPAPDTDADTDADADAPALRHLEIPFGPFLILGALAYLFFGKTLTTLWLGAL